MTWSKQFRKKRTVRSLTHTQTHISTNRSSRAHIQLYGYAGLEAEEDARISKHLRAGTLNKLTEFLGMTLFP